MKKSIIPILIVISVALIVYGYLAAQSSQEYMMPDRSYGKLGEMPIEGDPLYITIAPGLQFKIDTGCDLTTISEHDLALLDSLGYKAKKSFHFVLGRNIMGDIMMRTTRYTVDLPLYLYDTAVDSIGRVVNTPIASSLNVLHNVDFVPSRTSTSVIGIDFLEKFKVEYEYDSGLVALYLDDPEDYEPVADLYMSNSPVDAIWLGHRYYIDASVEDRSHGFFIDTGIRNVNLKLPVGELKYAGKKLLNDTVASFRGNYPATVDRNAWVAMGNRIGRGNAYYYDNDEEPYALNPFYLFDQDVVLDFPGKALKLRPYIHSANKKRKSADYIAENQL